MNPFRACTALLAATFLMFALMTANADEADALKKKFIDLADSKRPAAMILKCQPRGAKEDGTVDTYFSWGVFISEEGHALVNAKVLMGGHEITASCADDKPLKFGKILGLLPTQQLVLMKFDHKPTKWLKIAAKEPELNEQVVLVIMDPKKPLKGEIPALVGPIMAKRSVAHSSTPKGGFLRVLSLGGKMSQRQSGSSGGAFALNANGELVGFNLGNIATGRNVLIHLGPLTPLSDRIDQMFKEGHVIAYPIPKELNPFDLVVIDDDWGELYLAMARKDAEVAFSSCEKLLKKYPDSRILMGQKDSMILAFGRAPAGFRTEKPAAPGKDALPVEHIDYLAAVIQEKIKADAWDEVIELMKKQIAYAPKDYPHYHEGLAELYANLGRWDEALPHYLEAYRSMPDSIALVETIERLLNKQGRFKEADKMSERLYELERIYR